MTHFKIDKNISIIKIEIPTRRNQIPIKVITKASTKGTNKNTHLGKNKNKKKWHKILHNKKKIVGLSPKKKNDSPPQQHSHNGRLKKERREKKKEWLELLLFVNKYHH